MALSHGFIVIDPCTATQRTLPDNKIQKITTENRSKTESMMIISISPTHTNLHNLSNPELSPTTQYKETS
ncbi:hypothetical protein PSTG_08261 [Puccinia striiformis f. sp. tritici PST-78]|uniref:Uncharacterized protein n=1 Tax=Puccinia striiformis f. sp. tritici PST-78 TaxID=1165861 RepID=A0A0L0VH33_9BASI|nr:hypothetical protein PSTG_08261 [Puccinia striiformis f. sp. tritici PST-78]